MSTIARQPAVPTVPRIISKLLRTDAYASVTAPPTSGTKPDIIKRAVFVAAPSAFPARLHLSVTNPVKSSMETVMHHVTVFFMS